MSDAAIKDEFYVWYPLVYVLYKCIKRFELMRTGSIIFCRLIYSASFLGPRKKNIKKHNIDSVRMVSMRPDVFESHDVMLNAGRKQAWWHNRHFQCSNLRWYKPNFLDGRRFSTVLSTLLQRYLMMKDITISRWGYGPPPMVHVFSGHMKGK